jgi:hypothetical protein
MGETYVEYACRYTGWIYDPASRGEIQSTRYDVAGFGETGLSMARSIVSDTRAWQPHHGLPVDAVVVSRQVSSWAAVAPAPPVSVPAGEKP